MTQCPSMWSCTFQGYLSCSLFPFSAVSACAWSGHLKSAGAKLSSGLCTPHTTPHRSVFLTSAPGDSILPRAQAEALQCSSTLASKSLRKVPIGSSLHLEPLGPGHTFDLDRNRLPPHPLLCPNLHPTSMSRVSSASKSGCTYQDVIQASSLLTRCHRHHTSHTGLSSGPFRSWCCPEAHAGTRQPQTQSAFSSNQALLSLLTLPTFHRSVLQGLLHGEASPDHPLRNFGLHAHSCSLPAALKTSLSVSHMGRFTYLLGFSKGPLAEP